MATTLLPKALAEFAQRLDDVVMAGADLMLIVAHPDDETIGFGGYISQLPKMPLVCVTDGAPTDLNDARAHGFATAAGYATARQQELYAALDGARYPRSALISFGIADQHGSHELVSLTRRLARLVVERRPRFVITHAYEGGHPDHDAIAFAVAAAIKLITRTGRRAPTIVEMPFYYAVPNGIVFQHFVQRPELPELALELAPGAAAIKARMLKCHATQAETLAQFPPGPERFRLAPDYDFCVLPNGGMLQYERWGLGLTGADWLRLARSAADELERAA